MMRMLPARMFLLACLVAPALALHAHPRWVLLPGIRKPQQFTRIIVVITQNTMSVYRINNVRVEQKVKLGPRGNIVLLGHPQRPAAMGIHPFAPRVATAFWWSMHTWYPRRRRRAAAAAVRLLTCTDYSESC